MGVHDLNFLFDSSWYLQTSQCLRCDEYYLCGYSFIHPGLLGQTASFPYLLR